MRRLVSIGMAVVAMMAVAVPTTQAAAPQDLCLTPGAGVVPVTEQCAHRTYEQWSEAFWKWALGQPASGNPLLDPTGANCQSNQREAVFFLAGTFDGSDAERTCSVPAGRPLFFPIINAVDVSTPPGFCTRLPNLAAVATCAPESPTKLLADTTPAQDKATGLFATIDGSPAPTFRVTSSAFSVFMPADNLFGTLGAGPLLPQQAYMAVADGYYLLLAPLPVGPHTITFGGVDGNGGHQNNTYHLVVGAGR